MWLSNEGTEGQDAYVDRRVRSVLREEGLLGCAPEFFVPQIAPVFLIGYNNGAPIYLIRSRRDGGIVFTCAWYPRWRRWLYRDALWVEMADSMVLVRGRWPQVITRRIVFALEDTRMLTAEYYRQAIPPLPTGATPA